MEREREHVGQNLAAGEHRRGERHAATDVLAFTFHVIYAPYGRPAYGLDRKSTRLNSSHEWISYAVFCLKKKKTENMGIYHKKKHNNARTPLATIYR